MLLIVSIRTAAQKLFHESKIQISSNTSISLSSIGWKLKLRKEYSVIFNSLVETDRHLIIIHKIDEGLYIYHLIYREYYIYIVSVRRIIVTNCILH